MADIQSRLKRIEKFLKEKMDEEGIPAKYRTILYKLWQDYLYSQETKDISGDEQGWVAALYYILQNTIIKAKKSQDECAKIFNISKTNLGRKYRQIKEQLNLDDYQATDIKGVRAERAEKATAKKRKKITEERKEKGTIKPVPLSEELLKELFVQVKELVKVLHKDKEYFEIKKYLEYVELNLRLSGYEVDAKELEEKFGRLFTKLKMIPKKGREARKFVHLYDNYGKPEPFVLIKL